MPVARVECILSGYKVKPGSEHSEARKTASLRVFERTQVVTSPTPVYG